MVLRLRDELETRRLIDPARGDECIPFEHRALILAGSTKCRASALFELFQLEHVKWAEG
jgi:hypothetical protein